MDGQEPQQDSTFANHSRTSNFLAMTTQCQSCGMPLQTEKAGDCRGNEMDGSKAETWCKLCYVDGAFVDPHCSLQQMRDIVDRALIENGSGRIMRWLAQRQLPRLQRWR